MRILGIDPGIARTGWGFIEAESSTLRRSSGQELKAQNFGCIETTADMPLAERLLLLYNGLGSLFTEYNPEVLATEELFFNTNAKTALIVGQARGIIFLAAAQNNIAVAIYTPLQVKMALTGYGRADKSQIGQMVKILLKLDKIPKPDDVADALAIGITHAFSYKLVERSNK